MPCQSRRAPGPIRTGIPASRLLTRCERIYSNGESATDCKLLEHSHQSRCETIFGGGSPEGRASRGGQQQTRECGVWRHVGISSQAPKVRNWLSTLPVES